MRRALWFAVGGIWAAALTVAACSDDDATTTPAVDGGAETGRPDGTVPDSSLPDVSSTDSGGGGDASDAGQDATEAGPTTTVAIASSGWIRVFADAFFGEFLEDQTIVRVSNAPECVAHVWSKSKLFSQAGTLTVGGQIVGSDGGPPSAIQLNATPEATGFPYFYFAFDNGIDMIFPPDDSLTVQVQTGGTATIAAVPVQTLRPPPATPVAVTKPAVPDGGVLTVPSTVPFEVTWTAPDAGAEQRVLIGFTGMTSAQKQAHIFCGYALSKGSASIPANLLAEVRSRLGGNGSGSLHIQMGGQKEVVVGQDSIVIEVTRPDSTSFTDNFVEPQVVLQ